jgi:hypothetical protein
MPPVGFEPIIPAGERPQTYALDRGATGTGGIQLDTIQYSQTTLIIFYEFFVTSLDGLNRNIKKSFPTTDTPKQCTKSLLKYM